MTARRAAPRRPPRHGAGVLAALLGALVLVLAAPAWSPAEGSARTGRPLPAYLDLDPRVQQLVTVTSGRWSATRGRLVTWHRAEGSGWERVRGPVRVRLGWNGWVPGGRRRQSTGTTPAGSFGLGSAFGNRADPGTALPYRRLDADDMWPYEPRDPATYNVPQPFRSAGSDWRTGYYERLASYGREYAYAVVVGFNLPGGVHWSQRRRQYVAQDPADTRRGGGIFLHVQGSRFTAGCVAGPLDDVRAVLRWLDPAAAPRIVMGPTAFVKRRY